MSGKFEPKVPVQLDPPKSDPISLEALAAANGKLNVWRPPRPRPLSTGAVPDSWQYLNGNVQNATFRVINPKLHLYRSFMMVYDI